MFVELFFNDVSSLAMGLTNTSQVLAVDFRLRGKTHCKRSRCLSLSYP